MHILKRADMWMTRAINMLLVIMLLIASFIIFINVVLRYIFESGYNGSFELVSLLIISITFIGGSLLITENEHLTMDALTTVLPTSLGRVAEVIVCLVGIVFSTFLLLYSFKVMETLATGVTPVLQLPAYTPFLPLALGSLITTIKFIFRLIEQFRSVEG